MLACSCICALHHVPRAVALLSLAPLSLAPFVCGTLCLWHPLSVAPFVCGTLCLWHPLSLALLFLALVFGTLVFGILCLWHPLSVAPFVCGTFACCCPAACLHQRIVSYRSQGSWCSCICAVHGTDSCTSKWGRAVEPGLMFLHRCSLSAVGHRVTDDGGHKQGETVSPSPMLGCVSFCWRSM